MKKDTNITFIDILNSDRKAKQIAFFNNVGMILLTLIGVYCYWKFDDINQDMFYLSFGYLILVVNSCMILGWSMLKDTTKMMFAGERITRVKIELLIRVNNLVRVGLFAWVGWYHVAIVWGIGSYLSEVLVDKGKPVLNAMLKENKKKK